MGEKNSIANKKRWSAVKPEERSAIMSRVATIKHSKLSPALRREHAIKMVKARMKKKNGKKT